MKTDIDSIYLGIKYPCDLCEYQATEMGSMKVHIKGVQKEVSRKKQVNETEESRNSVYNQIYVGFRAT